MVRDDSPLIDDVDAHHEWAREAARFCVVLGLLLEAVLSALRHGDWFAHIDSEARNLTSAEVIRGINRERRIVNRDSSNVGGRPSIVKEWLERLRYWHDQGNPRVEVYPGCGVYRDPITITMDSARKELAPATYQRLRRRAKAEGLLPAPAARA